MFPEHILAACILFERERLHIMGTARDAAHRGLLKLMLRLPSLRGELQRLWKKDTSLENLCEAYEDATVTLERLMKESDNGDTVLVEEYRELCGALESDVERHCKFPRTHSGTLTPHR